MVFVIVLVLIGENLDDETGDKRRGRGQDEKTGKGFWDREDRMRSAPLKRGEQKGAGLLF